jgi:hypothetical protein
MTNPTKQTEAETVAAIRDVAVASAKGAVTDAVVRQAPTAHRLCTCLLCACLKKKYVVKLNEKG